MKQFLIRRPPVIRELSPPLNLRIWDEVKPVTWADRIQYLIGVLWIAIVVAAILGWI